MWSEIKNSVLDLRIRFEVSRRHLSGTVWQAVGYVCSVEEISGLEKY